MLRPPCACSCLPPCRSSPFSPKRPLRQKPRSSPRGSGRRSSRSMTPSTSPPSPNASSHSQLPRSGSCATGILNFEPISEYRAQLPLAPGGGDPAHAVDEQSKAILPTMVDNTYRVEQKVHLSPKFVHLTGTRLRVSCLAGVRPPQASCHKAISLPEATWPPVGFPSLPH